MDRNKSNKMSDDAVQAKTGKTWSEWFKILDNANGTKMNHKEIVAYLKDNFRLGSWWQQMVTVTYEQERGMRKVHEKQEGFQISKSKTFNAPVSKLYRAWINENTRRNWLKDSSFIIRTKNPNKNIRFTWIDNSTSVEVAFYSKENAKTQVTIQHSKLKNLTAAERMKKYWSDNLKKLNQLIQN